MAAVASTSRHPKEEAAGCVCFSTDVQIQSRVSRFDLGVGGASRCECFASSDTDTAGEIHSRAFQPAHDKLSLAPLGGFSGIVRHIRRKTLELVCSLQIFRSHFHCGTTRSFLVAGCAFFSIRAIRSLVALNGAMAVRWWLLEKPAKKRQLSGKRAERYLIEARAGTGRSCRRLSCY